MADKLLIVMVNADPATPIVLGAPLYQATVAAAMEYEVEVILTGVSGKLAIRGVAEKIFLKEGAQKSVYDIMREAHEAGVKFKFCGPLQDGWGDDDFIPEIDETVGDAYVISEAMDDTTVTFTY
jgi:predicted peroxiredoxin